MVKSTLLMLKQVLKNWESSISADIYEVRYHDGTLYATDEYSTLYAIDPSDGSVIWSKYFSGDGSGTDYSSDYIHPNDGRIFLTNNRGYVVAIHQDNGSIDWRVNNTILTSSQPIYAGGNLHAVGKHNNENYYHIYDGETGELLQNKSVPTGASFNEKNGKLYTSFGSNLVVLDPETGDELNNWSVSSHFGASTIAGGVLYTGGLSIQGYDLETGEKVTDIQLGG